MKASLILVDCLAVIGLILPGITVYKRCPDYIFVYAGAAMLVLLIVGVFMARRPKHGA